LPNLLHRTTPTAYRSTTCAVGGGVGTVAIDVTGSDAVGVTGTGRGGGEEVVGIQLGLGLAYTGHCGLPLWRPAR